MEKITKQGKVKEEVLNSILEENNLKIEEVVYCIKDKKGGLFKDAYQRIADELEEKLNEGVAKGWKLHSIQQDVSLAEKGLSMLIVWEVDK